MSSGFSQGFGDILTFSSYIKATSNKPLNDCVLALRESPRNSVWFGGFNTRLILPKSKTGQTEIRFGIEYYRQRRRSSRSSHMVQQLKGVLYREGGQTHFVGKVNFTISALVWFWLAIVLTLVAIGLLMYTHNVVMFILIGMTGSFLLAMIAVLWLDRYWLVRMIRQSMIETNRAK